MGQPRTDTGCCCSSLSSRGRCLTRCVVPRVAHSTRSVKRERGVSKQVSCAYFARALASFLRYDTLPTSGHHGPWDPAALELCPVRLLCLVSACASLAWESPQAHPLRSVPWRDEEQPIGLLFAIPSFCLNRACESRFFLDLWMFYGFSWVIFG